MSTLHQMEKKRNAGSSAKAAPQQSIEHAMAIIELAQLRKGAEIMARHILAQPAAGADALSEARRVANEVMAAKGLDEVKS